MTLLQPEHDLLHKVLSVSLSERYVYSDSVFVADFFVIPGNNAPRWLLPKNSALAIKVLSQWMPYGVASQLKWWALCFFYRLGLLARMPVIKKITVAKTLPKETNKAAVAVVPIIYVGTPGPQQKAVVTLVAEHNAEALAVLKIPLGKNAKASILVEAKALSKLAKGGVENVPKLISVCEEAGVSLQSIVVGKLAKRTLNKIQVDYLAALPKSGELTNFTVQKKLLQKKISQSNLVPSTQESMTLAINMLTSNKIIPHILVHGDFTPWNIKRFKHQACAVIDWEDADFKGLPLWDLCHFYFIQAHLFNQKELVKNFFYNVLVSDYLLQLGIDDQSAKCLLTIYVVSTILDESVSAGYRTFLISYMAGAIVK